MDIYLNGIPLHGRTVLSRHLQRNFRRKINRIGRIGNVVYRIVLGRIAFVHINLSLCDVIERDIRNQCGNIGSDR